MWKCCRCRRSTKEERYDENGRLPIHNAALENDVVALKQELDKAVPVDILSRAGTSPWAVPHNSPLMHAVYAGSFDAIKLLISHGASVNRIDSHGDTPMQYACKEEGFTFGKHQTLKILLQSGCCTIDTAGRTGMTALMSAVRACNIGAVELLILHKANCHAMDADGRTALTFALDGVTYPCDVIIGGLRQAMKHEKQFILDCVLVQVDQGMDLALLVYQYAYPKV